jgi:hypothetical protein
MVLSLVSFASKTVLGPALGFVAGLAMPGVIRKARALFFGEVKKAESIVSSVGADVKKL